MNRLSRCVTSLSVQMVVKRFAGGGGRPGAKPTFNWKVRRQLELNDAGTPRSKAPVRGRFGDVEDDVDMDSMIDVLAMDEGWTYGGELPNDKKQLTPSGLFGSAKADSRGRILKKRNYAGARFSHTRIFGNKKQQSD